jgi:hypothetical protein
MVHDESLRGGGYRKTKRKEESTGEEETRGGH